MGRSNRRQVVGALLERHGTTFAEEAGIRLGTDPKPSPLYRLLCRATLISAPIRTEAAVEATRGLSTARWRTARAMANSIVVQHLAVDDDATVWIGTSPHRAVRGRRHRGDRRPVPALAAGPSQPDRPRRLT
jgi:hypothetical protein